MTALGLDGEVELSAAVRDVIVTNGDDLGHGRCLVLRKVASRACFFI